MLVAFDRKEIIISDQRVA